MELAAAAAATGRSSQPPPSQGAAPGAAGWARLALWGRFSLVRPVLFRELPRPPLCPGSPIAPAGATGQTPDQPTNRVFSLRNAHRTRAQGTQTYLWKPWWQLLWRGAAGNGPSLPRCRPWLTGPSAETREKPFPASAGALRSPPSVRTPPQVHCVPVSPGRAAQARPSQHSRPDEEQPEITEITPR